MSTIALRRTETAGAPARPAGRRLRAGDPDLLQPRWGSSALADGQVNLISLDAIAEAFGDRWKSRRDGVYEHVEKVIDRNLGLNGYVTRISETDYLVAQPDLGPFGSQAACLRALREVLSHFLGAVRPSALSVCKVTRLDGEELTAEPIDVHAAMDGEAKEVAEARAAAEARADPTLLSPDRWTPFTAGNGKKVRVLGVAADKRLPQLPDVPTIKEATGFDYAINTWYAAYAPAKTPRPIIDRLNAAFNQALKQPDMVKKADELAIELVDSTPEQAKKFYDDQMAFWDPIIKQSGAKPE